MDVAHQHIALSRKTVSQQNRNGRFRRAQLAAMFPDRQLFHGAMWADEQNASGLSAQISAEAAHDCIIYGNE
jgi:hypothetical protein